MEVSTIIEKKELLKKMAKEWEMTGILKNRFVEFGLKNKAIFRNGWYDENYADDWARRFSRGEEYLHSDSDNVEILESIDGVGKGIRRSKEWYGREYSLHDIYLGQKGAEDASEYLKSEGNLSFIYPWVGAEVLWAVYSAPGNSERKLKKVVKKAKKVSKRCK